MESFGSERIREMHPQRRATYGHVKNLPHSSVAKIVDR
jgi:hypothetical protein